MPTTPGPPPPDWDVSGGSSTQFKNAQSDASSYGYDSTNLAIKDKNGADNFLAVGVSVVTTGHVAWFYTTAANANGCVYCQIPSLTFNVIKTGTLNTSTGQISYNSHVYQLQLQRDANSGNAIAFAYQVS